MSEQDPEKVINYGVMQSGGTSIVGNQAVGPRATAISRDLAPGFAQPSREAGPPPGERRVKVLFLAANPDDTARLRLDLEIREILEKVRAAGLRDRLDVVARWAVRTDDLLQHLNEHRPQVVHFSGHGARQGQILLEDRDGQSVPVSHRAVTRLLGAFADTVRLVVLNACFTLPQAEAITEVIDCATGTPAAIDDTGAIAFAASFYRAVGFGCSVFQAFEQAGIALELDEVPEATHPRLLARKGVDPSSITLT